MNYSHHLKIVCCALIFQNKAAGEEINQTTAEEIVSYCTEGNNLEFWSVESESAEHDGSFACLKSFAKWQNIKVNFGQMELNIEMQKAPNPSKRPKNS